MSSLEEDDDQSGGKSNSHAEITEGRTHAESGAATRSIVSPLKADGASIGQHGQAPQRIPFQRPPSSGEPAMGFKFTKCDRAKIAPQFRRNTSKVSHGATSTTLNEASNLHREKLVSSQPEVHITANHQGFVKGEGKASYAPTFPHSQKTEEQTTHSQISRKPDPAGERESTSDALPGIDIRHLRPTVEDVEDEEGPLDIFNQRPKRNSFPSQPSLHSTVPYSNQQQESRVKGPRAQEKGLVAEGHCTDSKQQDPAGTGQFPMVTEEIPETLPIDAQKTFPSTNGPVSVMPSEKAPVRAEETVQSLPGHMAPEVKPSINHREPSAPKDTMPPDESRVLLQTPVSLLRTKPDEIHPREATSRSLDYKVSKVPPRKRPNGPCQKTRIGNPVAAVQHRQSAASAVLAFQQHLQFANRAMIQITADQERQEISNRDLLSRQISQLQEENQVMENSLALLEAQKNELDTQLQQGNFETKGLKDKLHKVRSFVQGLGNDLQKLRTEFQSLKKTSEEAVASRNQYAQHQKMLQKSCDDLDKKRGNMHQVIVDCKVQLAELETHKDHLEQNLKDKSLLLDDERERRMSLEKKLHDCTITADQAKTVVEKSNKALVDKLHEIHAGIEAVQLGHPLQTAIDECLTIIRSLEGKAQISPDNLQKIEDLVHAYTKSVTSRLDGLCQSEQPSEIPFDQITRSEILEKLDSLKAEFSSYQTLNAEISSLRESNVTLEERCASTVGLTSELHEQLKALQSVEANLRAKLAKDDAEILSLKSQTSNDQHAQDQLKSAEQKIRQLQQVSDELASELVKEKENTKCTHEQGIEDRIEQLQAQLAETSEKYETTKAKAETVTLETELWRKQLKRDANRLGKEQKAEYENALHQANKRTTQIEKDITNKTSELESAREACQSLADKASTAEAAVEILRASEATLRSKLAEMRQNVTSTLTTNKNSELANKQIQTLKAELKAKEDDRKKLQTESMHKTSRVEQLQDALRDTKGQLTESSRIAEKQKQQCVDLQAAVDKLEQFKEQFNTEHRLLNEARTAKQNAEEELEQVKVQLSNASVSAQPLDMAQTGRAVLVKDNLNEALDCLRPALVHINKKGPRTRSGNGAANAQVAEQIMEAMSLIQRVVGPTEDNKKAPRPRRAVDRSKPPAESPRTQPADLSSSFLLGEENQENESPPLNLHDENDSSVRLTPNASQSSTQPMAFSQFNTLFDSPALRPTSSQLSEVESLEQNESPSKKREPLRDITGAVVSKTMLSKDSKSHDIQSSYMGQPNRSMRTTPGANKIPAMPAGHSQELQTHRQQSIPRSPLQREIVSPREEHQHHNRRLPLSTRSSQGSTPEFMTGDLVDRSNRSNHYRSSTSQSIIGGPSSQPFTALSMTQSSHKRSSSKAGITHDDSSRFKKPATPDMSRRVKSTPVVATEQSRMRSSIGANSRAPTGGRRDKGNTLAADRYDLRFSRELDGH